MLTEVRKIQQQEHPAWAFDCPQRIREHSIADACRAVKAAKARYRHAARYQQVRFRSRKDVAQRFGFDAASLESCFLFKTRNNRVLFSASEEVPRPQMEGTKVVFESGRWFLIIPGTVQTKRPENQRLGVVALDPGVRTFVTYYSPFCSGKIGAGDFQRLYRLCLGLDQLKSKETKAKCRQKRNLRKAESRLRWRIKDLVGDLHRKTAHFLVTRFDTILIPTFETSQMVTKLRSKTARSMLTWAHYRFKQTLKHLAERFSAKVVEVSEAYTSKTCSYCGKVHQIGSRKQLQCTCGVSVDRDYNGARGIYLRALWATTWPESTQACIC